MCAAVLLAAGFAVGFAFAHDRFYAPESLVSNEVINLDFNNRLMYYANREQTSECRRELSTRLREQVSYIESLVPDVRERNSRLEAQAAVQNARQLLSAQPQGVASSPTKLAAH
jgi:hypothetical protein